MPAFDVQLFRVESKSGMGPYNTRFLEGKIRKIAGNFEGPSRHPNPQAIITDKKFGEGHIFAFPNMDAMKYWFYREYHAALIEAFPDDFFIVTYSVPNEVVLGTYGQKAFPKKLGKEISRVPFSSLFD